MSIIDFEIDELEFNSNFSDSFQRINIFVQRRRPIFQRIDNFYISIHEDVTYNQLLDFLILRYETNNLNDVTSYRLGVNGWMVVNNYEERIGIRFHVCIHFIY